MLNNKKRLSVSLFHRQSHRTTSFNLVRLVFLFLISFFSLSASIYAETFEVEPENKFAQILSEQTLQKAPNIPVSWAKPQHSDFAKSNIENKIGASRFAFPGKVSRTLDFSQGWQSIGDKSVWITKLVNSDAKSINLSLDQIRLPSSAQLYFSSANGGQSFGPFSGKELSQSVSFYSPVVSGDSAVLAIIVDKGEQAKVNFNLSSVNLGFIDWQAHQKTNECQLDVVCSEVSQYQAQSRSVARFTVLGQFLCSGTLIDNTARDRAPYFLTAKHCRLTPSSAKTAVFYWNYQASICNGDRDGSLQNITFGSVLRAESEQSDFALLLLDKTPPAEFIPYWSGWDVATNSVTNVVSIHHPFGLEKSASLNFDSLRSTGLFNDAESANGDYWRVNGWQIGTTTSGSSGAAIWNDSGRLVGTLTGGFASCEAPLEPDWFGKMQSHWNKQPDQYKQLAHWLDPAQTSELIVNGSESCDAVTASIEVITAPLVVNQAANFRAIGVDETMQIFWDFDDDGIVDGEGVESSFEFEFLHQGNIRMKVVDNSGCSANITTRIQVQNDGAEFFPLGERLSPRWNQSRGSDKGWRLNQERKFEGKYSLKSERIQNEQVAGIELVHNFERPSANFFRFAISTSTESGDKLKFFIDNIEVDSFEGDVNWQMHSYPVSKGVHVMRWEYQKDDAGSKGADAVWIDAITDYSPPNTTSGSGGIYWIIVLLGSLFFYRKIFPLKIKGF